MALDTASAPLGKGSALSLLAGALAAQTLAALPPLIASWSALLLALGVAWRSPRWRLPALLVLGFAWACVRGDAALGVRIAPALEGRDIEIHGQVIGLPQRGDESLRFDLRPTSASVDGSTIELDGALRLSAFDPSLTLAPGQSINAVVRLKRPRGVSNPGGFDFERFALERRYAATGYVREIKEIAKAPRWTIDGLRQRLSTWIAATVEDPTTAGLLRALAVGDQGALADDQWDVLRATGTTHLIAISGLHIGMVAGLGALLARMLLWLMPGLALRIPRPHAQAALALITASTYAALAGWSAPVARTLIMIVAVLLARLFRRAAAPASGLALAAIALLVLDPLAVLGAGFWLSFVGVGWLILCMDGRRGKVTMLREFGRAQWAMTLGLLPLSVWFFQQSSLVGPLANLIAIPWISLVVVPVLLVAVLGYAIWPGGAAVALKLAAWLLSGLWWLLQHLAAIPWAQVYLPEAKLAAVVLAALGAFVLLLPRAVPGRWLGAALLLPLLWPAEDLPAPGQYDLVVFDVGQGLSVLVRTREHAMLIDAGPSFRGGLDMGEAAIVPALHAMGIDRLDALLISHADNDHAGGAASVTRSLHPARTLAGPDVALGEVCAIGQSWEWDGVPVRLLHPPADFPALGNQSSCVLQVGREAAITLFPGDIDELIEQRLVREYGTQLKSAVLIAPHHGSASSSSTAFLQAVAAPRVIVSAGYRNRFGHPSDAALRRYATAGMAVDSTIARGALSLRLDPLRGIVRERARRRETHRYWHEP